ncbi:ArpU family transcriptional regulator [Bacillus cereus ATCC 10876]|uniref:ArpU family transcriptional regulator n=4 Tax=Bacillus thuringiensis TaxID=1428 RepID=A0A9W4A732_BACTO|nr:MULTISPECIES: ArpU family phage packaging/lysis transcriptional regulator [Bacillus]MDJ0279996.1 ArpU family phage packaging/lysis transcriptional regulator [Bacillus bombysepticus]MEB4843628.1 ArpU family phage packaging/lysis transcriptional regulator [Paenibacillus jamilae]ANC20967.1 ArpU family transcriptional regulator [Bacillus cereus]KFL77072.1 phage transcriptional regulator, ArpU family protein [Bacillus cereus ATCC 10876]MBG9868352.1 ArpU family transcriptional regulator [Bacillus
MNKQLSFKMPIVDGKRTKQEIEKVFNEYRRYLATMPCDMLPKVTASYSIVPPSNTNEFNSSTENIAIERIEYEQERNKFMSWLYDGVNRLRDDEREVIVKFYMEHDSGYDQDIWMDLGIGKTKYYKLKGRAILRLAFNLKKEVFQKTRKQKEGQSI